MTDTILKPIKAFTSRKKKQHYTVHIIKEKAHAGWLKKQNKTLSALAKAQGFKPKGAKLLQDGASKDIYALVPDKIKLYEGAKICQRVEKWLPEDTIKSATFDFEGVSGADADMRRMGGGSGGCVCYS